MFSLDAAPDFHQRPLIIRRSRSHLKLMFVTSLVFLGVSYFLLGSGYSTRGYSVEFIQFVAMCGIAFSCVGAIVFVITLIKNAPALRLDDTGITVYSVTGHAGLVPWTSVQGLRTITSNKIEHIAIDIAATDAFIEQFPVVQRSLRRISNHYNQSPIVFPVTMLDIDRDWLVALLLQWIDKFVWRPAAEAAGLLPPTTDHHPG